MWLPDVNRPKNALRAHNICSTQRSSATRAGSTPLAPPNIAPVAEALMGLYIIIRRNIKLYGDFHILFELVSHRSTPLILCSFEVRLH